MTGFSFDLGFTPIYGIFVSMNDILNFDIPEEIYIDNAGLEEMVRFGTENFCFPEEVLSHFGMSPRYYRYWLRLNLKDKRATYIVDRFESMVNIWLSNTRSKILKSYDMKALSSSLEYLQQRHDERKDMLAEEDLYQDGWV